MGSLYDNMAESNEFLIQASLELWNNLCMDENFVLKYLNSKEGFALKMLSALTEKYFQEFFEKYIHKRNSEERIKLD